MPDRENRHKLRMHDVVDAITARAKEVQCFSILIAQIIAFVVEYEVQHRSLRKRRRLVQQETPPSTRARN
jgi:hypothetical protein